MQVSMKHAVAESVPKEVVNQTAGEKVLVKIHSGRHVAGCPDSQEFRYRDAFQELSREDSCCGTTPEDCGNFFVGIIPGIAAQFIHVVRFTAVVEFLLGPGDKLLGRGNNPVKAAPPHYLDQANSESHSCNRGIEVTDDVLAHDRTNKHL